MERWSRCPPLHEPLQLFRSPPAFPPAHRRSPRRQRDLVMQQFVHAPPMIADPTRHCRGLPRFETAMRRAEVVERAHEPHPCRQARHAASPRSCPACQGGQARPDRPVQSLDVCRLNRAPTEQAPRPYLAAMRSAARHRAHPSCQTLLDHLSDHQPVPLDQSALSPLSSARLEERAIRRNCRT